MKVYVVSPPVAALFIGKLLWGVDAFQPNAFPSSSKSTLTVRFSSYLDSLSRGPPPEEEGQPMRDPRFGVPPPPPEFKDPGFARQPPPDIAPPPQRATPKLSPPPPPPVKRNMNGSIRLSDEAATTPASIGQKSPPRSMDAPQGFPTVAECWDKSAEVIVQGNSLRTWTFERSVFDQVHVMLKTDGRPMNANIDLWQGPDNTPERIGLYIEDGKLRPFSLIIPTPRDKNAVAVRNVGNLEFPLRACVVGTQLEAGCTSDRRQAQIVQGGAIKTYAFSPQVASVQIFLYTDGRPLNARIELLQGPNNNKQVMELYTEDGLERPFFCILETPGSGNVLRVQNTATIEFPLMACAEPYKLEPTGLRNFGKTPTGL